jgi:hypothetical protein
MREVFPCWPLVLYCTEFELTSFITLTELTNWRIELLHFTLLRPIIIWNWINFKVQSYVTTDGQSASLSYCQAPIWGLRPDFYYCQTIAGLLMWHVLSDERTGLPFTITAGPRQRSHSWVRVETRDHILLSQIRDYPNLEGQVRVFIYPRSRVAPKHWVPFSSPPTTRGATVEVFEPASPRGSLLTTCRCYSCYITFARPRSENPALLLVSADRTENISRGSYWASFLPSKKL